VANVLQLLGYGHNEEQIDEEIRGIFTMSAALRYIEPELRRTKNTILTSFLFKVPADFSFPNTTVKFSEKFEET
jgi:hypothetical protein